MEEKFLTALNKIADELLEMDKETFETIIETHKNGEYAQTLRDINFFFENELYDFSKTYISVSFETTKIDSKINDDEYSMVQTKMVKIEEIRTINIGENEWLIQAA